MLTIDKGWHLYANPTDDSVGKAVEVTASVGGKAVDVKVDYPKGTPVPAQGEIKAHSIYEGTVTVKVTVDRSKLGSKPIDLNVNVSACDPKTCLFPGDIKLTVP